MNKLHTGYVWCQFAMIKKLNLSGPEKSRIRTAVKEQYAQRHAISNGGCSDHKAILQFIDLTDEGYGCHKWLLAAKSEKEARSIFCEAAGSWWDDEITIRKVAVDRYLVTYTWTPSWAEYI